VYIAEAHAKDVWPLGNHVEIADHKSFEERVAASDILIDQYQYKLPVVYDTMTDDFDKKFAVWPERYYLVRKNDYGKYVLEWISYPSLEIGVDRDEMERLLQDISSSPTNTLSSPPTLHENPNHPSLDDLDIASILDLVGKDDEKCFWASKPEKPTKFFLF